jgi:hypothetical protein
MKMALGGGLGLRYGGQFGLRAKVMAKDLKPNDLTQQRNWHLYPYLHPRTYFLSFAISHQLSATSWKMGLTDPM